MCGSILTENSSPPVIHSGGDFFAPTPGGVPVRMRVPAGRVVPCERNSTICATVKIMSLLIEKQKVVSQRPVRGVGGSGLLTLDRMVLVGLFHSLTP